MENHTKGPQMSRTAGGLCAPDWNCPVTRAVQALGGKWKLHIIFQLMQGTKRFSELHRAIPKITQQMLTAQLRELETDGIVSRKVFPEVPPRVEYSLTPLGLRLRTVTDALTEWGLELPMDSAQMASREAVMPALSNEAPSSPSDNLAVQASIDRQPH